MAVVDSANLVFASSRSGPYVRFSLGVFVLSSPLLLASGIVSVWPPILVPSLTIFVDSEWFVWPGKEFVGPELSVPDEDVLLSGPEVTLLGPEGTVSVRVEDSVDLLPSYTGEVNKGSLEPADELETSSNSLLPVPGVLAFKLPLVAPSSFAVVNSVNCV